jgi:hypothetical protein
MANWRPWLSVIQSTRASSLSAVSMSALSWSRSVSGASSTSISLGV